MPKLTIRILQLSLLCFLGSNAVEVMAQSALEEVVVTARKREESLQDTPISVAAFSADDLQDRGIVDFSQVGEITPNVTFDFTSAIAAGNSAAIVSIRGVGASDWTIGVDPGVGIYLDGVYIARTIGQVLDTADVAQVEILRGPQGTLFGRNTIGGAISVTSQKPTPDRIFGSAEITAGSYDRLDISGRVNVPITDNMAASLSLSTRNRDGYVKNLFPGGADLGDNEDRSGRMALSWEPADTVRIDVAGDYSTTNENPAPNVLIGTTPGQGFHGLNNLLSGDPQCLDQTDAGRFNNFACYNDQWAVGPFQTWSDHVSLTPELQSDDRFGIRVRPASELVTWGFGGTVEIDISDSLTLKSITAHRRVENGFWSRDSAHSGNPAHVMANTSNDYEQKQTSQEFQLIGSAFDDRLNYILGFFWLEEHAEHLDVVELPLNTVFDSGGFIDNTSKALFAQGTYDISDQLHLTAGLRFTDEDKEFVALSVVGIDANGLVTGLPDCLNNPIPLPGDGACVLPPTPVSSDTTELQPYVNLSYDWNDDLMTYVSYSEGFKAGAFTQRVFPPALATPTAGPEYVKVYEGGFKSSWFDNRVRLNGALFFTDYTDLQVNVNQPTGTGGGTVIGTVTDNAASAEILGFELEMTALPIDNALIQLGIGYLDAEYVSFDPTKAIANLDLTDDLINTPKWNINLSGQYEYNLGEMGTLTPRFDMSYASKTANDSANHPLLIQKSYALLNLSMTWRDNNDAWSATVAGNNVTDKTYLVTGFAGSGIIEGVYGLPSTWSFTVRRNFN
ncbi:MAG: TonB-dependent receptor [Gammaproteobacteria bacterium]|nr:TonB-dependent receptor [Gammaproteobacteria bacterium]